MTILRIKLHGDMDVHGCNFLSVILNANLNLL